MYRKQVWAALGTVVAVLGLALSARANKEALAFNEAIIENIKKLNGEAYAFGQLLRPLIQESKEVDQEVLGKKLTALKNLIADLKKGASALKAPEEQTARDYLAAYEKLLKGQGQVIEVDCAAIVEMVGDEKLDLKTKKERVSKTLQRLVAEEQKDMLALRAAQKAFAHKSGLKLGD